MRRNTTTGLGRWGHKRQMKREDIGMRWDGVHYLAVAGRCVQGNIGLVWNGRRMFNGSTRNGIVITRMKMSVLGSVYTIG
jgi:hypothetical protein